MENKNETLYKIIKIADLENFEVYAHAPCYKYQIVCAPNYYIDDDTGLNIGQELRLAILPDGTYEPLHHSLFVAELGQVIKLSSEDIPDVPSRNF